MYLGNKDEVLEKLNRSIIREKEIENMRLSTLWLYRCIILFCVALSVVCISVFIAYSYRDIKLTENYKKTESQYKEKLDTLTRSLEDKNKIISEQDSQIKQLKDIIDIKDSIINREYTNLY